MRKVFQNLKGRTVLITGASSGLGEAIAYEVSKKGARVILCARTEKKLVNILEKCESFSGLNGVAIPMDISDYHSVESGIEKIQSEFSQIDVLVNCAGFGRFEDFLETDFEETEKMFRVNVLGLIYLTQKIALMMTQAGQGHIINVASQAGKMATPKSSIYAATKFAVIGFSNSLRLEMKPFGISVTTINPGPIKTPFFDKADPSGGYLETIGRLALNPEELAQKVVNLMGTYKRELNAPGIMAFGSKCYQLFPHAGDFFASSIFNKK